MFKGDKKKLATDSPERLNRLVEGTKVNGDLTTESNLRVDGDVIGTIQCKGKFVLGQAGTLKGDLTALEAEIEGHIEGDIKIDDVLILRKTAIIQGKISSVRLVIEDGAQLGGAVQTGSLPKSSIKEATKKKKEDESYDVVY